MIGFRRQVDRDRRAPVLVNRDLELARGAGSRHHPGRAVEVGAVRPDDQRRRGVRGVLLPEHRSRGRVLGRRRPAADDARRQPSRRPRERPPDRHDQAAPRGVDERAAQLEIIAGIQQGLAARIDIQAMCDLVGDRLGDLFDAQVFDIAILDREAGEFHFPYTIERGERFADSPTPYCGASARHVMETRRPLVINERAPGTGGRARPAGDPPGRGAEGDALGAADRGRRGGGRRVVQNLDRGARVRRERRQAARVDRREPQRVAGDRAPDRRDAPARGRDVRTGRRRGRDLRHARRRRRSSTGSRCACSACSTSRPARCTSRSRTACRSRRSWPGARTRP